MSGGLIPAIVVGGYLGAGKTTLINSILRDPNGVRATVLVNDFGAINIDADLIMNKKGDTIALTNGCACCSIGDSLLEAAQAATHNQMRPDVVVVEASGVSHPRRIADMLMGVAALAPATCVTVVNGARVARNAQDKYVGRLFATQIETADFLSLNRFDKTNMSVLQETCGQLPRTISSTELLHVHAPSAGEGKTAEVRPESLCNYQTTTLFVAAPVPLENLKAWLGRLPEGVERLKGVLWIRFDSGSEEPRLLSYSQGLYDLTPANPKQSGNSGTLVAIFRNDAEGRICAFLDAPLFLEEANRDRSTSKSATVGIVKALGCELGSP